jgi:hypothetical protein
VEAVVTDTEDEIREFARITLVAAAPEMARFNVGDSAAAGHRRVHEP